MYKFLISVAIFFLFYNSSSLALMSHEEEARLGRQVLQMLRKEVSFVQDPEVLEYVKDVGQRVAAHVGPHFFPFRFYVIKDETLNAFAVPGGFVFINTGLIEEIDREDELAGVIAHELAHVQARHLAKRIEKLSRLNLATAAMTIAALLIGKGRGGEVIISTANALAATKALSYSRADEEQADRLAFQYLVKAGYDPRGMIEVFNKIIRHRWLLSETVPSYLLTHPTTPERMSYLESLIYNYQPKITYKSDPLRLRRIQIRIKVLTHDPGNLVIRYQEELQNSQKDPLLHYGLGLALAKLGRFKEAIKELQFVIHSYPKREIFLIDLASIYFEANNYQKALEILQTFIKNHPSNTLAKYLFARIYQELGEYEKACLIFKNIEEKMEDNPEFHYYFGQIYATLNKEGLAHYQFAKHFLLKGDVKVAIYHLYKAYNMLPKGDPLRAKIRRQIKSLKDEMQKQKK